MRPLQSLNSAVTWGFSLDLFAYIDGTTGGMALQVLLGGIAGGLVVFKLAAKSFFARFSRGSAEDEDEAIEEAQAADDSNR